MSWAQILQKILQCIKNYKARKLDGPQAPKGEKALLSLYGDPNSYPSPQAYWSAHGVFAEVSSTYYDHIPFLRKHGGFWCHRMVKKMVEDIFDEVAQNGHARKITSFDGCYNHRVIRGGSRLSMHAFGAAIDLNAASNPMGSQGQLPIEIVEIFERNGWSWGGRWTSRPDPMHFAYGSY